MKKKIVKVVAFVAVVTLLFSVVACGSNNATVKNGSQQSAQTAAAAASTAAKQEAEDFNVFTYGDGLSPDAPTLQFIKEHFGVNINFTADAGNIKDKLNIWAASGDYQDGIISQRDDVYQKYVDGGHLLAIDSYLDKEPNYKKAIEKYLPFYTNQKDGKLYFIPSCYNESQHLDNSFNVRYDLWDAVGRPAVKTNLDLENLAKLMKEKMPKVNGKNAYPFAFYFGDTWGDEWYDKVAIASMGQTMYSKCNLAANGKRLKMVDYMVATKEYHDAMKWANRLYHEGLADPQSAVYKNTDYVNAMNNGTAFIGITDWDTLGVNAALSKAGHPEQVMDPMYVKWDGYTGKSFYANIWGSGSSVSLWLTDKCKIPEKILAIADYMNTPEGEALAWYGLKDKNYSVADGKYVLNQDTLNTINSDSKWGRDLGFGALGGLISFGTASTSLSGQNLDITRDSEFLASSYSETEKKYAQAIGVKAFNDPFISDFIGAECTALPIAFVLPQNSEELQIKAKADTLSNQVTAQLFLAKDDNQFEQIYNKALNDLKAMHYEKFVKIYSDNLEKIQDQMGLK